MALPLHKIAPLYTVRQYLEMERASEVRHEYLDGEIFEMAGETLQHGRLCTNLVTEFRNQLRGKDCDVLSKDTKVRSSALISPRRIMRGLFSYPDVVVVCGQPQFHDEYKDIIINPTVIIQVLSDTTERFDRGEKFRRYRAHSPTLTDYLLVAQHEAVIDWYTRGTGEKWELLTVEGLDVQVTLDSINCTLKLSEVYDRVEFPPPVDELESLDEDSSPN